MKAKKISDETTNRGEFNRAYKRYLEGREISCSYCRYHRGENGKGRNYYGGYEKFNGTMHIKYPNWKLTSKNSKQWMEKSMKIVTKSVHNRTYIDFKW